MCSAVLPITRPITSFHKPRELSLAKEAPLARLDARQYTSGMQNRVCYIHVGPHKTGTTSIQWCLQENRSELLKHGYFVPESETKRGAHHAIAESLAGLEIGAHREPLVDRSIRALRESTAEAIIISSEALEGILKSGKHAGAFFGRLAELNLEPKLVLFPRNHPQWINSSYASL